MVSSKRIVLVVLMFGLMATGERALALTQSVSANMSFDTPLTLTKQSDINFGTVKAEQPDTYVISTSGVVTHSGGGSIVSGTPTPGHIIVMGSPTQAVDISTSNYVADGGVMLQNATCSYGGGPQGACAITGAAGAGAGKVLLVGIDAVVDGTQVAGTSVAPTFTVSISYQ